MRERKPILHWRDHEHGGADVVRIPWEDIVGAGSGATVANMNVAISWENQPLAWYVYLHYLTAGVPMEAWTISDDPESVEAGAICDIAGSYTIDFDGTLTHSGTASLTDIQLQIMQGGVLTNYDVIASAPLVDGYSAPITFALGPLAFVVGDTLSFVFRHQNPDAFDDLTTLTGVMTVASA